jgi:hypothetical protein
MVGASLLGVGTHSTYALNELIITSRYLFLFQLRGKGPQTYTIDSQSLNCQNLATLLCSTGPGQLPASRQDSAQLPKGQGILSRGRVIYPIKMEIKKPNVFYKRFSRYNSTQIMLNT